MPELELILYICAAVSTIGAAISVISNATLKVKKPYHDLAKRIADIEAKQENYDMYFQIDKRRLDMIELQQSEILKALFALLSHATDNNDVERCKQVKNELQEFLVKKGVHV